MLRSVNAGAFFRSGIYIDAVMEYRKNTVRILAIAITLASIGLIAVQVRLLMNTAELKRSVFDQTVRTALTQAAQAIDHLDMTARVFMVSDSISAPGETVGTWVPQRMDSTMQVSVLSTDSGTITTKLTRGILAYSVDRPLSMSVEAFDDRGRLDTVLIKEQMIESGGSIRLPGEGKRGRISFLRLRTQDGTATFNMKEGSPRSTVSVESADTAGREYMVRKVVESFDAVGDRSFTKIEATTLDSIVSETFLQHAIDIPHIAAVLAGDSVVVGRDSTAIEALHASPYKVPIGPRIPFRQNEVLAVVFPSAASYVLTQMRTDLVLSLGLVGVIIWAFVYSLRTLVRQRQFAGRLTDFINNMTHEFKTPVSTIGLASEALDRADVVRSAKKVRTYNDVIRDENLRMRGQIDRILQMATLEEGEVDFRKEAVQMHTLLQRAVDATRVQVTAHDGTISTAFDAAAQIVTGDALHLEGVVHNVLENAVKYSPERPSISVTTLNDAGMLIVRVTDTGVGVASEHLPNVFDKFFRVPTGNIHDVKGFGLGLSYVKLVVEKHGGKVTMKSSPGRGTTIEIRLPVSHET